MPVIDVGELAVRPGAFWLVPSLIDLVPAPTARSSKTLNPLFG